MKHSFWLISTAAEATRPLICTYESWQCKQGGGWGRGDHRAGKAAHLLIREGPSQKKSCWGPWRQTIKPSLLFFQGQKAVGRPEQAPDSCSRASACHKLASHCTWANLVWPRTSRLHTESSWETAFGIFHPKDEALPEIRGCFFYFSLPKVHFPTAHIAAFVRPSAKRLGRGAAASPVAYPEILHPLCWPLGFPYSSPQNIYLRLLPQARGCRKANPLLLVGHKGCKAHACIELSCRGDPN